ncbi:MAG: hypothetical protein KJZ83_00010 [Burkholderiaceae bacterium]|nr:hypothetical protein [Burkholderiaceae bacterium]
MAVIIKKKVRRLIDPDPLVAEVISQDVSSAVDRKQQLLLEFVRALAIQAAREDHRRALKE